MGNIELSFLLRTGLYAQRQILKNEGKTMDLFQSK